MYWELSMLKKALCLIVAVGINLHICPMTKVTSTAAAVLGCGFSISKNLNQTVKAETLFYQVDNKPVSDSNEHKTLHNIKLATQFPTCLAQGTCTANELRTLQNEIAHKLPDTKVCFIPRTLYELFLLHFLEKHKENIQEATKGLFYNSAYSESITSALKIPNICAKAIKFPATSGEFEDLKHEHAALDKINSDERIEKFHQVLNNHILDFIKKNNLPLPLSLDSAFKIVDNPEFWEQVNRQYQYRTSTASYNVPLYGFTLFGVTAPFGSEELENKAKQIYRHDRRLHGIKNACINKSDIKRTLQIEYEAADKQQILLFRGKAALDQFREIKSSKSSALSYGLSWLSGVMFDNGRWGATPYLYKQNEGFGYALPIPYKEYADKQTDLQHMFYIPPVSTIAGMIGYGELFHPRSKEIPSEPLFGLATAACPTSRGAVMDNSIQKEDQKKLYRNIFTYIQKNHIPFGRPRNQTALLDIPNLDRLDPY